MSVKAALMFIVRLLVPMCPYKKPMVFSPEINQLSL